MSANGKVWLIDDLGNREMLQFQELDQVVAEVACAGLASPALIVVGGVVRFAARRTQSAIQELSRKQA